MREAANAWAEEVDEQLRAAERAERKLAELGVARSPHDRPSLERLRAEKERELEEALDEASVARAPLPAIPHDRVVERALRRALPFDAKGKDGYRDTLLWETVLMLARDENVVFVTRDVRAFSVASASEALALNS